ncbi:MAG: hypothetical protein IPL52_07710 [Flavobacteriales bacterium]|nr:hypothetical protein [Flavobacteriales bacterium]
MKHALLFPLLMLASMAYGQSQVITRLTQNGQSQFEYNPDNLVTFVQNSNPGDTIILPGGPLNLNGSLIINEPITIIGAGVLSAGTPITGITTIVGEGGPFAEKVLIQSGGAGSSLHGIRFEATVEFSGFGNNAPSFSATFVRCLFTQTFTLGAWSSPVTPPAASNVHVKQCIFLFGISNAGSTAPQGFLAENCIIDGGVSFGSNSASAVVTQCMILDMTTINGANPGVQFTNNVFTRQNGTYNLNSASTYNNNLFILLNGGAGLNWAGASGANNATTTNTLNVIFANVGSYQDYDQAYDYHFIVTTWNNIGLGGFQPGIHGGPAPWKEGAIPFNPHWISLSPALGATNGGTITVNLSGAAQQD